MKLKKDMMLNYKKKTNELKRARSRIEEVKLDNEVLREQVSDQNKLIERLENGLQLALDQVDYLTQQLSGSSPVKQQSIIEDDDDDINYDDLDEATLTQLLAQTRDALYEKRKDLVEDEDY